MAKEDKKKDAPKELAVFLKEPTVIQKFQDIMGDRASSYIQSVLIAVADSEELRKCTHQSILQSALRAASLELSCDPAVKQAWLVPFNKKVKGKNGQPDTWIKVAQFQPHYLGLYALAMRTGKYFQITVSPIYEGERVYEDILTGMHRVQQEDSELLGLPQAYNGAYRDVTVRRGGKNKNRRIIGWMGYFKTKRGFEKSIYMSIEEIGEHAEKYVKELSKNQNWNDTEKRKTMEMKTVLKALLNWADKSGTVGHSEELEKAIRIDNGEEVVDGFEVEDTVEAETETNKQESK